MGGGVLELRVVKVHSEDFRDQILFHMVHGFRLKLDFNVRHILFYKEVQFSRSVMSDSL